ncbi:NAD(P)H pyrophosphatase NUDT13, mitochondrial isoform X5 [Macrotis lagotis]|uniref:NAD(P)H pyrophosphatase NUDT13, mitochondrial isoform X5 n=1 Tax=Macrotis lagotis TaxID=92651 RepID=UPI003D68F073
MCSKNGMVFSMHTCGLIVHLTGIFGRECSPRYLFELKEDDDVCRKAQKSGMFYLFHSLAPLLQKSGILAPPLRISELERILGKFGQDTKKIEHSVLIGCSDQLEAWFALDLGLGNPSSSGSLQKSEMETELQGSFIELRKSLFQLNEKDASLVATMSPVVIILVSDGTRCLLARQSSFPKGLYSALSGFCDVGETLEETVRREVAEEVGLELESLHYSASQHWPFPNSCLMIACHATVGPGQTEIHINSQELEAASWFSLEEVITALQRKIPPASQQGSTVWVPPKLAIAHHLICEWVQKQSSSSSLS